MKSSILILVAFFFTCTGIIAQNEGKFKQTIRGTLVDEDTQSPIIGANVVIANSNPLLGTTTDIDGQFRIENIPVGRQSVMISYLGYESKTLTNLLIGSGKELVLEITLTESIVQMETITVTAGSDNKAEALNEMAMVSARSFSVEETKRFAAGIGDPARMMTAYAGITSNGGDDENGIIIRGNSPRGLLWRLEGVEIPNPNHFASEGASSGSVSILSSNTLSKSDFYTGAFPAEFGNALSGAFDIKLRNGNNEKREYAFQASVLGLEAALEGPFKKGNRASYLVNYRYSTLGLFTKLGINIVDKDEETTYQDVSFKVNIPTEKAGTFSFYGIGGLSSDEFKPTGGSENYTTNSDVGVAGVNHLFRLNNKSYLKSFVTYSGTRIIEDYTENTAEYQYESTEKKAKTYLRVGTKLRTKLNARHIFETGVTYSRLAYDFNEKEEIIFGSTPPEMNETFNQKGNSGTLQAYGSWKYRISENLSWINGLHFLQFGLNKNAVIEPRSALKWQFSPTQSIGFGFGMHSRIESLEYYLANSVSDSGLTTQPNKNLDFTKARHYVLSYDNVLSKNWYLKAEAYYQNLYNVPVHHDKNSIFSTLLLEDGYVTDSLVNKGTGTNYGLELTIQRFFNKHFYMLFSASLYEAKYKAADGKQRNTPFNSNFGFNLLAGKEFVLGESKQNLLGFNMRASWGGNKRYVPVNLETSRIFEEEVSDFDNAYQKRLPDYWKIDFQISYRLNKANLMHEFRFELLNVTNHKNVYSNYYNDNTQKVEYDHQTGIIPAIGYRIEF
ncbi:MAG: TonB-dependent receptor [Bacteroidetes bacterium]|nr:TonB-dependent receptor [Bacteroidota bacterium]